MPNIYIYMDRGDKKVYRQFRMIYKENTNELVYCVEPGATLSKTIYEEVTSYDPKFKFSPDKWERFKKIAYFGYGYKNHTDLKWYAITQYIIWLEYMPSNWEMYFVDKNHHKLENLFKNEIDEIYNLVNNSKYEPDINLYYDFNYNDDYLIKDNNNLLNRYISDLGIIKNNTLDLNNSLIPGINEVNLSLLNYQKSSYYYNPDGQNILTRGDVLLPDINFYVSVNAGKLKINECDEKTNEFLKIGATYEILDQDSEVIDTIDCKNNKCTSSYLPVGNVLIRVSNLDDEYIFDEHIYDATIYNDDVTDINICFNKKDKEKNEERKLDIVSREDNPIDTHISILNNDKVNVKTIDIPKTSKNSYVAYIVFLVILTIGLIKVLYVKIFK